MKGGDNPSVVLQVGLGGDCGVFTDIDSNEISASLSAASPMFRVIVNQKSLRRGCKKIGNFALSPFLNHFQLYAEKDWDDKMVLVSLENVDRQIPSDKDEWEKHEQLAFWEIEHVVSRIKGEEVCI